jgi:hypothetical protein
VAVTGAVARLALIDASTPDSVLDESVVDVSAEPTQRLAATVAGTDRSLSAGGHRLAATGVCWADHDQSRALSDALTNAGVAGVRQVPVGDAATAFVRESAATAGQQTSALLLLDDETAALTIVGADAATTSLVAAEPVNGGDTAVSALLERLREEPSGAQNLYALTTSGDAALTDALRAAAPVPVRTLKNPAFAIARGAALAGVSARSSSGAGGFADSAVGALAGVTAADMATATAPQVGQLAYSLADDGQPLTAYMGNSGGSRGSSGLQTPMAPLSHADDPREADGAAAAPARPRMLLLGSTIAAIVIVGFAVLAVGVAIGIKPTAGTQAVRENEAVPGKYLPVMPGQGTAPIQDQNAYLPPVVPVAEPPAGSDGSTVAAAGPDAGTFSPASAPEGQRAGPDAQPAAVRPPDPVELPALPMPEPPPGGFRLSDWLPQGLNINVGQLYSDTQRCKNGDIACFVRATGCAPKDSGCLTKNFVCTRGVDCAKTTTETCQQGAVRCGETATVCPSGATTCQTTDANTTRCSSASTCPPTPPGTDPTAGTSRIPDTKTLTTDGNNSHDSNSTAGGGTTSSGGKDTGSSTGTPGDTGTGSPTAGNNAGTTGGPSTTAPVPPWRRHSDSSTEQAPPPHPVTTTAETPPSPPVITTTEAAPRVITTTEAPAPRVIHTTTEAPPPPPPPAPEPAPEPEPAPAPAPKPSFHIPFLPAPRGGDSGSSGGSSGGSSNSGSDSSGTGSGSSGSGSGSSGPRKGFCVPFAPCKNSG